MEEYIYAVTRVHAQELRLLGAKDFEQLIAAKNAAEVFRFLADKGWEVQGADNASPQQGADNLILRETERTWELISELMDDTGAFDVFRCSSDYHNLKAAIKLNYSDVDKRDRDKYFLNNGTVELKAITDAAELHDFTMLPGDMAAAGREAYEVLIQTRNGQNCDMILDRAALNAIFTAGLTSKNELLREYATITVDQANIKAAVRCCAMKKDAAFIDRAVADCGSLDTPELVRAASQNMDVLYEYLGKTRYSSAVAALKSSMSEFERWCDNQMIEMIKPQKSIYFGLEPVAAYILARENEIKMVRLILSAKINGLPAAMLRERLRDSYV